mgnify:CR=1 FL=1
MSDAKGNARSAGGMNIDTNLVRELADLVPGAEFRLIRGAGHLPPIDRPEAFAAVLTEFLAALGHG